MIYKTHDKEVKINGVQNEIPAQNMGRVNDKKETWLNNALIIIKSIEQQHQL